MIAAALKAELRNAIWLGIKEARVERRRRNELVSKVDDQITRLAAAQLITEDRLQAFLSASTFGNGHTS